MKFDFLDKCLFATIGFCSLMLILILIGIAYEGIDSLCLNQNCGEATIIKVEFVKEHYSGKAHYNPSAWYIYFQLDNKIGRLEVSYDYFSKVHEGQKQKIKYGLGRLSGDLYPTYLILQ